MQSFARMILFSLLCAACELSANTAPVVNAGPDTTTTLNRRFSLNPLVEDDTLPNNTLITEWKLLSGPDSGAVISLPEYLPTRVIFSKTGVYLFQLTATDGALSDSDSVYVTVLDSVPFIVLDPQPNDTLFIGSTYRIGWQYDPPGSDVTLALSTDGGMDYSIDILAGPVRDVNYYEWTVPDEVPVSNSCYVRVRDYKNETVFATLGPFTIMQPVKVRKGMVTFPVVRKSAPEETFGVSGRYVGLLNRNPAKLAAIHGPWGIAVSRSQGNGHRQVRVEK